jgi:hypothetical protein
MQQEQTIDPRDARIQALEAQLKAVKAEKRAAGAIKISPKGAISVYGLGKWPVTLYASQWETIFGKQEDIKAFIVTNIAALASKKED